MREPRDVSKKYRNNQINVLQLPRVVRMLALVDFTAIRICGFHHNFSGLIRGSIQKFPDWFPGTRTASVML